MNRLKFIGISALAVLALGSLSASAAQAAEGTAVVSAGATGYVAKQVGLHTITLPGGRTWSCEVVEFTGTVANGDKDMTVTPKYEKCHAVAPGVTLPLTIETTGCTFTFTDFTTTGVADTYSALTDICQSGGPIHIKMYATEANHTAGTRLCEYTIAKQGPLAGVSFKDNTNGTLNFTFNEFGIALTRTFGTAANCGEVNTTTKYNGNTSMIAAIGTLGLTD